MVDREPLAATAESVIKSIATTEAKNQKDPDDATAVATHATKSITTSTIATKQKKDDNPAAGRTTVIVAGTSSATLCC